MTKARRRHRRHRWRPRRLVNRAGENGRVAAGRRRCCARAVRSRRERSCTRASASGSGHRRPARATDRRWRRGRGGQVRAHRTQRLPAARVRLPHEHLVEHQPERVEVAAPVDVAVPAATAPGSCRSACRDGWPSICVRWLSCADPRDAEVHQFRHAPPRDHDVRGLDIPMDDLLLMHRLQRLRDVHRDRHRPRRPAACRPGRADRAGSCRPRTPGRGSCCRWRPHAGRRR